MQPQEEDGVWIPKTAAYIFCHHGKKADANLDVYRGTADAISQNIDFIDTYAPEYLLVLSGDHIYKMDYDEVLDYHKEHHADATIAVIEASDERSKPFWYHEYRRRRKNRRIRGETCGA